MNQNLVRYLAYYIKLQAIGEREDGGRTVIDIDVFL
jgi:hypothetical protein